MNLTKLHTLTVLLLFMIIGTKSGYSQSHVGVSSVPPEGESSLKVGGDEAAFTVYIANLGTDTVDVGWLTIELRKGLQLMSATENGYPIMFSENVIFVQRNLFPYDEVVITYMLKANCDIIPDGEVGASIEVRDDFLLDVYSQTYGSYHTSQSSQPYTVYFADQYVSLSETISGNTEPCSGAIEAYNIQSTDTLPTLTWNIEPASAGIFSDGNIAFDADFSGSATLYASAENVCKSDTATLELSVTKSPDVSVSCDNLDFSANPISLTGGLPLGGTYSGAGVANGVLDLDNKSVAERNQIRYSYTNAAGCESIDSCIYTIPCEPTVFMTTEEYICLGDTIELYVRAHGLTEHCLFESYLFASTFGSLTLLDYSADETIEPNQVFMESSAGPLTMIISQLMGTFYPKSGNLIKIRLLAPASGDYTINLMNFQFGGTTYPVDSVTIHVSESPTVSINDSAVCENSGYTINTMVSDNVTGFEWSTGSTESSLPVTAEGSYVVIVRSDNGCTATDTATVSFVTIGCAHQSQTITSIDNKTASNLLLEPVPATTELRVNAKFCIRKLIITDAQGHKVAVPTTLHNGSVVVDITKLPQGFYILHASGENGQSDQTAFTKE